MKTVVTLWLVSTLAIAVTAYNVPSFTPPAGSLYKRGYGVGESPSPDPTVGDVGSYTSLVPSSNCKGKYCKEEGLKTRSFEGKKRMNVVVRHFDATADSTASTVNTYVSGTSLGVREAAQQTTPLEKECRDDDDDDDEEDCDENEDDDDDGEDCDEDEDEDKDDDGGDSKGGDHGKGGKNDKVKGGEDEEDEDEDEEDEDDGDCEA